jgi:uncharacterized protein with von Willebrand factor type A (vWA) domain
MSETRVNLKNIGDALDRDRLDIPLDRLKSQGMGRLSKDNPQKIEVLGGWKGWPREFTRRARKQTERTSGGNEWIGSAGTSPHGHDDYNTGGIRVGDEYRQPRTAGPREPTKDRMHPLKRHSLGTGIRQQP